MTYFKAVVRKEAVFGGASYDESKWFPTQAQAEAERGRLYDKAYRQNRKYDYGWTLTTGIRTEDFDHRTESILAERGFLIKAS